MFRPCPKPEKHEKKKPKLLKRTAIKKDTAYKIPQKSDKRKVEDREYTAQSKQFKLENPICQINHQPGCTGKTTDTHHAKGRTGDLFLDMSHWKAACDSCHKWATKDSKGAKETGASESILTRDLCEQCGNQCIVKGYYLNDRPLCSAICQVASLSDQE